MKAYLKIVFWLVFTVSLSGCKKEASYDIDFIVRNKYPVAIHVVYKVKICTSINNGCNPQQFEANIAYNSSSQLTVEDKTTSKDPDIRSVFQLFEIYNNGIKSDFDFWETSRLTKTNYDDKIEYILEVNGSFF